VLKYFLDWNWNKKISLTDMDWLSVTRQNLRIKIIQPEIFGPVISSFRVSLNVFGTQHFE